MEFDLEKAAKLSEKDGILPAIVVELRSIFNPWDFVNPLPYQYIKNRRFVVIITTKRSCRSGGFA